MASWAAKRQIYYLTSILAVIAVGILLLVIIYWPQPSCSNGKQDINELGTDCGGVCTLACRSQVLPIKVIWTRVFQPAPGKYDVAALVENPNSQFGVKKMNYLFRLLGDDGVMVTSREGRTFVNPNDRFVLMLGGLDLKNRKNVVSAQLDLADNLRWEKMTGDRPAITVEETKFENMPFPKLYAMMTNNSFATISNVQFVAVLSDRNKNVIGVSQTMVDKLYKNNPQKIYFTWPTPFAEEPSFIDVYPQLNLNQVK